MLKIKWGDKITNKHFFDMIKENITLWENLEKRRDQMILAKGYFVG